MKTFLNTSIFLLVSGLFMPQLVSAHGSGFSNEGNFCRLHIESYELMVSSYQPKTSGYTPYCADLPKYSESVIVLDFVDPALRNKPIGAQIIKLSKEQPQNHEDHHDGKAVASLPFDQHQTGTMKLSFTPEKGQRYAALITALNHEGIPETIDFPFTFEKPKTTLEPIELTAIAMSVLISGVIFLFFMPAFSRKK